MITRKTLRWVIGRGGHTAELVQCTARDGHTWHQIELSGRKIDQPVGRLVDVWHYWRICTDTILSIYGGAA